MAAPWRRALLAAIERGYRDWLILHASEAEIAPGIRIRPVCSTSATSPT